MLDRRINNKVQGQTLIKFAYSRVHENEFIHNKIKVNSTKLHCIKHPKKESIIHSTINRKIRTNARKSKFLNFKLFVKKNIQ